MVPFPVLPLRVLVSRGWGFGVSPSPLRFPFCGRWLPDVQPFFLRMEMSPTSTPAGATFSRWTSHTTVSAGGARCSTSRPATTSWGGTSQARTCPGPSPARSELPRSSRVDTSLFPPLHPLTRHSPPSRPSRSTDRFLWAAPTPPPLAPPPLHSLCALFSSFI